MEVLYVTVVEVVKRLAVVANREICLAWGMEKDLKKLEHTMSTIKAVLLDAEKKQEENEQLRVWLRRINDVFQDAQDVLAELECELLRRLVVKTQGSIGLKVCRFFSRSNPLVFRFRIGHQIKAIRKKLRVVAKDRRNFHLMEHDQDERSLMQGRRDMTSSFVRPSEIIGRDADKEKIMVLLMQLDDKKNDISVLPIVGIGGLGKTTLAKLVYNDERVQRHFELKMWVCVSNDFNVPRLTKEILDSATGVVNDKLTLDQLQTRLRDYLRNKTFLLVLDDVWNDDRERWIELRDVLMEGSKRSKIIVTTRNSTVASVMGTMQTYSLRGLSPKNSLSLFTKCAFEEGMEKQHQNLIEIGEEIVEKCKGVPLAVRTLGSRLYGNFKEYEWKLVRDNEIWELGEKGDRILHALRISYTALPSYLKQSFLYCSLFPKDHKIYAFDLFAIWMAHGVLQSPDHVSKSLEHIGEFYLEMLMSRAFLEVECWPSSTFHVHDLIHDLALSVGQDEFSQIKRDTKMISKRARHCAIMYEGDGEVPQCLDELNDRVRTVIFPTPGVGPSSNSFIFKYLARLKYLRVLDLSDSSFEKLPNYVGSMKHLRYLSLSRNRSIKKLPDSICELHSLQTLRLDGCENLQGLPRDIKKLVSVRFLSITTKESCFSEDGVPCLTSLRTLIITSCKNLKCLPTSMKSLTRLESLMIGECEKLTLNEDHEFGTSTGSINQLRLRALTLIDLPMLETLPRWFQGCANTLQHLNIEYCSNLVTVPNWLLHTTCRTKITISGCPSLQLTPRQRTRIRTRL